MPSGKKASSARQSQRSVASGPLAHSMDGWLVGHGLMNLARIWAACIRRTHSWRVPPRWSLRDWWDEVDAEIIAASCQAIRRYDHSRGLELSTFVYHQVMASALARYRQEWSYGLRYGLSLEEEPSILAPEERFAVEHDAEQLKQTLTQLTEDDRSLIQHIFWDGRTETEVADGLGISQQAVSKRKRRIMEAIRAAFENPNGKRRTRNKRKRK